MITAHPFLLSLNLSIHMHYNTLVLSLLEHKIHMSVLCLDLKPNWLALVNT